MEKETMNIDLYAILGVRRNATVSRIQKAYRRLAMQYHPDRNAGDEAAAEKFKAVQQAWDTLGDPVKRRNYDLTGEVDDSPDNTAGQMIQMLGVAFANAVEAILKSKRDLKHENLVECMTGWFKHRRDELRDQRKVLVDGKAQLEIVVDRFSVEDGGSNIMQGIVRGQLAYVADMLKKLDAEVELIGKAEKYLKTCRYRADIEVPQLRAGNWITATTGAW